jgi:hypothetical protein
MIVPIISAAKIGKKKKKKIVYMEDRTEKYAGLFIGSNSETQYQMCSRGRFI